LSAALKALEQPGLEQAETLRLRSIIQGVRSQGALCRYVDIKGFEAEVLELRRKLDSERDKKAIEHGIRLITMGKRVAFTKTPWLWNRQGKQLSTS